MTAGPMTEDAILARLAELAVQIERLKAQTFLLEYEQQTLRQRLRPEGAE
ncbi:MAG: hypothetical protein IT483_15675 [Gammaproteobacteria bacterium]|nr:hypothetical protein [Gammaproteobacteria bacterium]